MMKASIFDEGKNLSKNEEATDSLTPREMDVLRLLAENYSNREIAHALVLSPGTVKWYNKQIYNKLVVNSREKAVAVARQMGILARDANHSLAHNLPGWITPFIGRKQELKDLTDLLTNSEVRLVTIMGSGGMGKTRLALEAGRYFVYTIYEGVFNDGIYFVDLAPVSTSDSIITAIADAVDFQFATDQRDPQQQLLDYLKHKNVLLILDNFEHLLDSAGVITECLRAAADVTMLVTSRVRLNLSSQTTVKLTGLDYPVKQRAEDALKCNAVQLFIQSAQRVRHDFVLEPDDVSHVVRICRLVQGLPLGIILAATWVEILSLPEIDHELTRSIDFLASEQRDLPRRLRSIRAVFEYSWNLMSDAEANIFMKLCVFRGGFTRDAAHEVASADLRILINLTNKSLIQHEANRGRYSIHELLRQYTSQQLQSSGQWDSAQHQHAQYYAQLAERAAPELRLANQEQWFHTLELEHDNLRAAIAWSLDSGEVTVGLRIITALRDFWFYEGYHVEAYQWCERALKHVSQIHPILQGRLRLTAGLIAWARHQMDETRHYWEQALTIFQETGERRYAAWALGYLGGSKFGIDQSGYEDDVVRIEAAIDTLRKLNDLPGVAQMLNILGNVHRIPQHYDQAKLAYERCLGIVRQTGEKRRESIILSNLALVAYAEADYELVKVYSQDGVSIAYEIGFKLILAECLHTLAGFLGAENRAPDAARLAGAVDAFHEYQGLVFAPNDQHYHDRIRNDLRQHMDDETFQAYWHQGYQMSIDAAVEFVLSI
ncbi:MAG: LuxR C-terminal-related transcriptional regulator [Chloroflexi bacterium]|nr:LuxR C-terminal-related transcriptional regulator [Chloroflexota bacterium]